MLFLAGFLEHLQKGFLSNFLYVLSSMYQQEVRQRERTLISNVIPEQVQDASLLQIDCHVIILQPFALNNKIAFCKTLKEKRMLVSSLPSIHIHSRQSLDLAAPQPNKWKNNQFLQFPVKREVKHIQFPYIKALINSSKCTVQSFNNKCHHRFMQHRALN